MILLHQANHTAESNGEGTDSPIIFSLILGHLATTCFMILNWVCINVTCPLVSGPISLLSRSSKGCEPFTFSPLIGFSINDVWCLTTPQSQYSVWLCIHKLICFGVTYNFLSCVQCLCNTCTSNLCQGTSLPPLMV